MKLLDSNINKNNQIIKADKFFSAKTNIGKKTTKIKSNESNVVLEIEKKVIKIDDLFKSFLTFKKNENKKKIRSSEIDRFRKKEENLEKKKPKKEKNKNIIPIKPKLGIFGWLTNFITNVVLGFIFVRLIDHLPTLAKLIPIINGAMDGIIDWGGKLLDGLVTFIDWGYSAYDNTVKVFEKIGGKDTAKKFEDFMGKFQDMIQYTLIAGMLFADLALSGGGYDTDIPQGIKGKPSGVPSTSNQAARRYAQRFGKDAAIKRFGREGVRSLGGKYARSGATNLARNAFVGLAGKGGAKTALKFLKPFTKKLPIIGGLLDFGLSVALGEDPGRAAFKAIGATLLGAVGAALGGPFALLTGFAGGWLGDQAGGALYDALFKNKGTKSPSQNKSKGLFGWNSGGVIKAYAGGGSTRGGQYQSETPKRELTIKKPKRRVIPKPAKLRQGSISGGTKEIQKVFPEPSDIRSPQGTGPQKKEETMNSFGFLSHSYYRFASVPFIGPLLAMPLKVMLGDTVDYGYYKSIGQEFDSFLNKAYDEGAFSDDFKIEKFDIEKIVSKSVEELTTKEMSKIRSDLMQQLMLEKIKGGSTKTEGDDCICPEDTGGSVNIQGGSADFWTLVAVASREDGDPQSWADVAQSVYNRLASGAYSGRTIKDLITAVWQYEPTWRYPSPGSQGRPNRQWFTITDAASAAAASGQSVNAMKSVASAILNPSLQANARSFIQGRTDFTGYPKSERSGQIQRKSGDNYFGWDWSYRGNKVASVPNFSASSSPSNASPTTLASSSPAGSVSDCSCDDDNIPDPNGINTPTNPEALGPVGKKGKIYLHWNAAARNNPYGYERKYHAIFTEDGKKYQRTPYSQFNTPEGHTAYRNSLGVGLAVAGMGGAGVDLNNYGSQTPTQRQYEAMAQESANLAKAWGWSPSMVNVRNVATHAEVGSMKDGIKNSPALWSQGAKSDPDNHGPVAWGGDGSRWDLFKLRQGDSPGSGGDKIRSMIKSKMGSAGKFGGGSVNEGLTKVHPGEFIIDKDSVDTFGINFMDIINEVENKSQLSNAKQSLIKILEEIVPEYSENAPDKVVYNYIPRPSSGGMNVVQKSTSIINIPSKKSYGNPAIDLLSVG